MNIVVERHPKCLATLRVEIPADKVAGERARIVGGFAHQARIPGFRPGKAPRQVIEKRFERDIAEELESRLVHEAFEEALRTEKLRVLDFRPPQSPTLHPDGAFSFVSELVLAPDFELPAYKGIEIEVPRIEVTDQMIDQQLEQFRTRFAEFIDIEDRAAAAGDYAVIDFTATLDGRPLDEVIGRPAGFLAGRQGHWLRLDDESFLPGFAPKLVGMRPGEQRDLAAIIPPDFPLAEARGREVSFHVVLASLKRQALPELNDELAGKILADGTLERLRDLIRERISHDLEQRIANFKVDRVVEHLNRQVSFDLPEQLLTAEIQGQADAMVERGLEAGMSNDEISGQQAEIFNAAGRQASTNLRTNFILQEIARTEGLTISDKELLQHLALLAQQRKEPVKKFVRDLRQAGRLPGIRNSLLIGKAIDFVVEQANVHEVEPPQPTTAEPTDPSPPTTDE